MPRESDARYLMLDSCAIWCKYLTTYGMVFCLALFVSTVPSELCTNNGHVPKPTELTVLFVNSVLNSGWVLTLKTRDAVWNMKCALAMFFVYRVAEPCLQPRKSWTYSNTTFCRFYTEWNEILHLVNMTPKSRYWQISDASGFIELAWTCSASVLQLASLVRQFDFCIWLVVTFDRQVKHTCNVTKPPSFVNLPLDSFIH